MTDSSLLRRLLARGRAGRPLIGGHRGSSARAPENTLAAFRAALEDGAELVELDVHLTRDGQLAVVHDEQTQRTTGVSGLVAAMTMDDLRLLDAGNYKGAEWEGEGIPELGDVLAMAHGHMLVNVEIKGGIAAATVVARRVAEHDMAGDVIVSSFEPSSVAAAAALRPPLLSGLLLDRPVADPIAAARAVGAALLHVEYRHLSAPLVQAAHQAGLGVLAWTVNVPGEMRRLASIGADAILSDDPRLLRAIVGEEKPIVGRE